MTSPAARGRDALGQLDALVHGRVLGGSAEVQQLEQPEPEHRQHRRVEPRERAAGEPRGHVIERRPALDGAVAERHRQRAVARLECGRLAGERPVGVAPCSNTRRMTRSAHARAGETPARGLRLRQAATSWRPRR